MGRCQGAPRCSPRVLPAGLIARGQWTALNLYQQRHRVVFCVYLPQVQSRELVWTSSEVAPKTTNSPDQLSLLSASLRAAWTRTRTWPTEGRVELWDPQRQRRRRTRSPGARWFSSSVRGRCCLQRADGALQRRLRKLQKTRQTTRCPTERAAYAAPTKPWSRQQKALVFARNYGSFERETESLDPRSLLLKLTRGQSPPGLPAGRSSGCWLSCCLCDVAAWKDKSLHQAHFCVHSE